MTPPQNGASVGVGARAPDFALPGTDGTEQGRRTYSLHACLGSPVVLVFYPADGSPVCTAQLTTYTNDIERFAAVGAQVLAISPQSVEDHDRFAAEHGGFAFPLLADERKAVAEIYGVLGPIGFYRRSVFIVGSDGMIGYAHRATAGLTFRPTEEIVEALRAMA